MMSLHKVLCSCFGIGYIKGGGTIAALVCCTCWYLICKNNCNIYITVAATLLITVIGIWSAGKMEMVWGEDSSKVVIDEAAGMCVSLLYVPVQLKYILTALILFRFFDIAKPLYIRNLEKLSGGWGVMADDLLSGIYTNLILQAIVLSNLF